MKIALVHDYLREYGGAERVLEVMHELWPKAPLYTALVDWEGLGEHAKRFRGWDIRPSWVQHNPIVRRFISPLRFLAPRVWESFDFSAYDVVLSSSGWFISRGVIVKKPTVHICYIHHPPRHLYGYATGGLVEKYPLVRAYASVINFFLRHYDYETAQRVDYFIANSKETARRVRKFYRKESTVIYPPIQNPKSLPRRQAGKIQNPNNKSKREYFLSVGRLEWAKRTDLAIEACNKIKVPLKIVGTGSEEERLRSIAGPTIEFLGPVSDEELAEAYGGAKALIFCSLDEDFGMVPVEAMAHGVPVIGLGQGGVRETVVDPSTGAGQATGVLFKKPEVADLIAAIKHFKSLSQNWAGNCRAQAQKFSVERFKRELQAFVEEKGHPTPSK